MGSDHYIKSSPVSQKILNEVCNLWSSIHAWKCYLMLFHNLSLMKPENLIIQYIHVSADHFVLPAETH